MQPDQHIDALRRESLSQFLAAVDAFSEDPRANLERYLTASRALEESRRDRKALRQAGLRAGGATAGVGRGRRPLGMATGDP